MLIAADDLMWSTRLVSQAVAAGADARAVSGEAALRSALDAAAPQLVVVDLSARSFDALAAVRTAAARTSVLAVASHEDHALRKNALAAGALRVYAYRKMHADGPAILREWLAQSTPAAAAR